MQVKFWGVRGSIPVPGETTVKYGGNTTCIEVNLKDKTRLVLDAGTGIRKLGVKLMAEKDLTTVNLFITHAHWDHIQGFPFFWPAHSPDFNIQFYASSSYLSRLVQILRRQMESEYFPISFENLSAQLDFNEIHESTQIGPAQVTYFFCNHPGGCTAYKITEGDRSMVFMTDNELSRINPVSSWQELVSFCQGADLLIHDAQYTPEELKTHHGWGHSSYREALSMAMEAGVKKLVLFHHDPDHTDAQVDAMLASGLKLAADTPLQCLAATEGETIEV